MFVFNLFLQNSAHLKPESTMKKSIKTIWFTLVILVSLTKAFGQKASHNIVFLTDFYTTFLDKVKASGKNSDSIYETTIQSAICNEHFQKSEYAYIAKDFFSAPIKASHSGRVRNGDSVTILRQSAKKSSLVLGLEPVSEETMGNTKCKSG